MHLFSTYVMFPVHLSSDSVIWTLENRKSLKILKAQESDFTTVMNNDMNCNLYLKGMSDMTEKSLS